MTKKLPLSKYNSQDKLKVLIKKTMLRIDSLLELLNLEFHKDNKKFSGSCPIHGGDKYNAFNLYHAGEDYSGNWKCRTKGCEHVFLPTIIGFVRGVLSHNKYGWTDKGDKIIPFDETIEFILSFLNEDYNSLKVNLEEVERTRFVNQVNGIYCKTRVGVNSIITRDIIRRSLKIPAEYYLNRKYSPEILDKYDVGLCKNKDKPMFNRVVVPIYDDTHKFMIGCTGRSVYKECPQCQCWHPSEKKCPSKDYKGCYPKWLHSKDFQGEEYLYNYWNAKQHIQRTKVAILVESPGNVWRLEEAGIHNSVGLFGTSLSDGQRIILDSSGALSLILLLDNDSAGNKACRQITKQCERIYNIHSYEVKTDIGDMKVFQVKRNILPFVEKIQGEY